MTKDLPKQLKISFCIEPHAFIHYEATTRRSFCRSGPELDRLLCSSFAGLMFQKDPFEQRMIRHRQQRRTVGRCALPDRRQVGKDRRLHHAGQGEFIVTCPGIIPLRRMVHLGGVGSFLTCSSFQVRKCRPAPRFFASSQTLMPEREQPPSYAEVSMHHECPVS
jgi:hypothetical protein